MIWIESVGPYVRPLKDGKGCTFYHTLISRKEEDIIEIRKILTDRGYHVSKNILDKRFYYRTSVKCTSKEWRDIRKEFNISASGKYKW